VQSILVNKEEILNVYVVLYMIVYFEFLWFHFFVIITFSRISIYLLSLLLGRWLLRLMVFFEERIIIIILVKSIMVTTSCGCKISQKVFVLLYRWIIFILIDNTISWICNILIIVIVSYSISSFSDILTASTAEIIGIGFCFTSFANNHTLAISNLVIPIIIVLIV